MSASWSRRSLLAGACALGAAALGCRGRGEADKRVLVLSPGHGAKPDSAHQLQRLLSKQAGRSYEVRTGKSAEDALRMATAAETDGALLTVFEYMFARRVSQVEAILRVVRGGAKSYRGEVIAKAGAVPELKALEGSTIAYVDRFSSTGYLLAAMLLAERSVRAKPLFVGSHAAVLEAVRSGKATAGATYAGASEQDPVFSVLAKTKEISNEPVFVRAALPASRRQELRQDLLSVATSDEGRRLLTEIAGITGFEAITDDDYADSFKLIESGGRSVENLVPRGWLLANEQQRPVDLVP